MTINNKQKELELNLNSTPSGNRKHIVIMGRCNVGKSSLLNAIVGQEVAIVSSIRGTTTDPVLKSMEFLPLGPVVFIDTAGLDDEGGLGRLRVQKSKKVLQRADYALLVHSIDDFDENHHVETLYQLKVLNVPYLIVFNKIDQAGEDLLNSMRSKFPKAVFVSANDMNSIHHLKNVMINELMTIEEDPSIIGDLLSYGGTAVLVVPVDSEAPKGRIILPQVQVIRDCLDHGIKVHVVRETELEQAIKELKHIDLVITDSQAFDLVSQIVPQDIPLTSFSILFARHKGDLSTFIEGSKVISSLKDGARILISESCTHNHTHEDIGRVKIPSLLNRSTGKSFEYIFSMGHDFQEDLHGFDLIIHCGSCMINRKTMLSRISLAKRHGVPITNYGVVLAYINNILDRTTKVEGML
ncbi:MAG: [FeFe] hydrogenase H-cluster maturation GTPase HydF [Erysipelotrichaceae bacterium]|nr:[FeFe] hydrogenase H-cluster maturation GTPase HydF [Erysipelotrichaceae bacterium]